MAIRRASSTDVGRVAVTATRAFVDDPVMRWLYPDDEFYLAPGAPAMRPLIARWLGHDEMWVTEDSTAVAVWIPPGRPELESEPTDAPAPEIPEDLLARFAIIGPLLAQNTPPEEHWYLQMLATHPDWQRQGLGAALMAVQFERAKTEGLPCYLETETIENVAYYRRFGFEVRSEWDVDPEATLGRPGPHMWGMMRPA